MNKILKGVAIFILQILAVILLLIGIRYILPFLLIVGLIYLLIRNEFEEEEVNENMALRQ